MNGNLTLSSDQLAILFMMAVLFALVLLTAGAMNALQSYMNGRISLRQSDRVVLSRCLPYFAQLDKAAKAGFERRVIDFINDKEFHGRGIEVTREMKLMLAGSAVQVTFGLEPLLLMHFSRIVVYPDQYRNRPQSHLHLGEVNPGVRVIAISWKHFLEGYAEPTDARNVGLHEMAHALWFENRIPNAESDFLNERFLMEWRTLAEDESARIRSGEDRFFRDYAATDQVEFFAVAVEYFFEKPAEYHQALPELYECMVQLLKQDPAQMTVGYHHNR